MIMKHEDPHAVYGTATAEIPIQDIPPLILKSAYSCIGNFLERIDQWPEDERFQLSLHWDLHMWRNDDTTLMATIYPIVDNKTQTDRWYTLLEYNIGEIR